MNRASIIQRWLTCLSSIGALPIDSEEERLRKRALVLSAPIYVLIGMTWGLGYMAMGFILPGLIPFSYGVITLSGVIIFAVNRNFRLFRFTQLLFILLLPALLQLSLGGFANGSFVVIWALAAPMDALIFAGVRQAVRWFIAFGVVVVVTGLLDSTVATAARPVPPALATALFVINILGVASATYFLLVYFVRQRDLAQARSEQLLLNVLPKPIADRLKHNPDVIADQFDAITVLFADVVNFTLRSAGCLPEDVVRLLNEVFSAFDQLAERHGLEKINAIGDA